MNICNKVWITGALLAAIQSESAVNAFVNTNHGANKKAPLKSPLLHAAPKRLEENVEGVVYVNEKCINCAACSNFAPSVFRRADRDYAHIVHRQPETKEEILDARAAMAACPVAAIRSETLAQRRHRMPDNNNSKQAVRDSWTEQDEELVRQMALSPKVNGLELPFPRPLMHHDATTTNNNNDNNNIRNVYNVGHHNEDSFGATPYLVQATFQGQSVWILVDTPRFGKSAMEAVTQITGPNGPDYMFLTHVDDTADHDKWAAEYPSLKRIFHAGDTGRHNWRRDEALNDVEIMLPVPSTSSTKAAYALDGTPLSSAAWYNDFLQDPDTNVVILHTPGHSPGSITLWKKPDNDQPGIIFTGDHYAFTTRTGRMSGFPRYGNNLQLQAESLQGLLDLEWDVVAPGHGHPRDYSQEGDNKDDLKKTEMEEALMDLHK
ncbi:Lactamase_B [Seminavis robusta]|uniref:Lactamase_B n=1 Tax=Seminavis robusta TaxID=568900 RepID=A0A9N8ESL8_9STRA|nr:Lactamase_B [Seminavis robusta]|eukprot:Sro1563_g282710.1 Lactamase_B (434) ;mRNA; r:21439-22859